MGSLFVLGLVFCVFVLGCLVVSTSAINCQERLIPEMIYCLRDALACLLCAGNRPGHSRFEEKWLKDIIECKTTIISRIDF